MLQARRCCREKVSILAPECFQVRFILIHPSLHFFDRKQPGCGQRLVGQTQALHQRYEQPLAVALRQLFCRRFDFNERAHNWIIPAFAAGDNLKAQPSAYLKMGCGLADKKGMRALSIRQPYAELILRGTCGEQIKPIEFRSRPTKIIGQRFYIICQQAAGDLVSYVRSCFISPDGKVDCNQATETTSVLPSPSVFCPDL